MHNRLSIASLLLIAAHGVAQSNQPQTFPPLSAQDLNGKAVALPADFRGALNIVFIPFAMNQQREVDSWQGFVKEARKAHPLLQAYELPTIGKGYGLMRGIIDGGMRSGILDHDAMASTITLYLDVSAFARTLSIQSTKTITVLLVNPAGEILARVTGPYSAKAAEELSAALEAMG
jgi:hypothetical protein